MFECDYCPKVFSRGSYLKLHLHYHYNKPRQPVNCPKCDAQFLTQTKLNHHLYELHYRQEVESGGVKASLACRHCQRMFTNKLEQVLHSVDCAERKPEPTRFPCSCGQIFTAVRFLTNHALTCGQEADKENLSTVENNNRTKAEPGPPASWSCDAPDCGRKYNKLLQFKNHLFLHTEYPFICQAPDCRLSFTVKENYVNHGVRDHGYTPTLYSCSSCTDQFSVQDQLAAHVERIHEDEDEEEQEDDILGESFSVEDGLRNEIFPCKVSGCKDRFESLVELRKHYISHNKTLTTCSKCNNRFPDRESLHEHAFSEHNLQLCQVVCPFCEEGFPLKRLLKDHLESSHPKPWKCGVCNLNVQSVALANAHKEMHSPKPCDLCGLVFSSGKHLLKHLMSHRVDILSCPVQSCSIFFGRMDSFEKHLLQHQKDKIFKCMKCEYQCYNTRQLESHLDSGHTQKPKPHEFTSDVNLSCPFAGCGESFVQEKWLVRHRRKMHADWESDDEKPEPVPSASESPIKVSDPESGAATKPQYPLELIHKRFGKVRIYCEESLQAYRRLKGYVVDIDPLDPGSYENETSDVKQRTEEKEELPKVNGPELPKTKLLEIETDHPDGSEKEIEFFNSVGSPPPQILSSCSEERSESDDDFVIQFYEEEGVRNEEEQERTESVECSQAEMITVVNYNQQITPDSTDYLVLNQVYPQDQVRD